MGKLITLPFIGGSQMVSVLNVAKYFLNSVEEESGSVMTHLKLQKLCYYAQAWYLVFNEGVELFKEDFQAWAHGPACPELWHNYKDYGFTPIPRDEDFNSNLFKNEEMEILEEVWTAYGQFEPKYLELLTHQEEPWLSARGNAIAGERCTNVISKESMFNYYSRLLKDDEN